MSLEEALHVSASCSAQVSYRKTDNSLEKGESGCGDENLPELVRLFGGSVGVRQRAGDQSSTEIGERATIQSKPLRGQNDGAGDVGVSQ